MLNIECNPYLDCLDGNPGRFLLLCGATDAQVPDSGEFDTILVFGMLERQESPALFLEKVKERLTPDGKLLLCCRNRLGLKYFAGEPDPFTGCFGDGPENYIRHRSPSGRCYTLNELNGFLQSAELSTPAVYSVLPDIDRPRFIIAEDYRPRELMSIRLAPEYEKPERVFLDEEYITDALLENGLLPGMAGGLLLVTGKADVKTNINEICIQDDRGPENSQVTVLKKDGTVLKKAMFPDGEAKLDRLAENHAYLENRGIRTLCCRRTPEGLEMDFLDCPTANRYLQKLFFEDRDQFIAEMDRFRMQILQASEILEARGNVQKKAFPDMVPLNCFCKDGEYVFFDQEFCFENYPADAILTRSILIVYELDGKMEQILPKSFFFDRYGLTEDLEHLLQLSVKFTDDLIVPPPGRKKLEVTARNRERLNYPADLYEQLMYNPVAGLEHKEIYACGLCEGTRKFIEMYQRDYTVRAVAGPEGTTEQEFFGYPVVSEDSLRELAPEEFRAIVCCENYTETVNRLRTLGIQDITVYQPGKVYPGRQACALFQEQREQKQKKKYHIGYVAGVFDLYHLGHLNMFKRAKDQCDYLIVGVVTDAGVRDFKKTEPFIPFEERVEMVRSCRYVDEVVEIPYFYRGTVEAFEKYHFDVQFSGSDYENQPLWLYHKQWLEEHGSEMVFLPYTQQTSSTKIKNLIEKNLI